MNKRLRQAEILKLIAQKSIRTQEELAAALRKVGVVVAQVTLSRDIRELGIVKGPEGYRAPAEQPAPTPERTLALKKAVQEFVQDIRTAQNLVVLRTTRGNSAPVAYALDEVGWPEIVGTIAGEDTVFAACPNSKMALRATDKLRDLLR